MAGSIASLGSLTPSLSPAPEDDLDIPSAEHTQDAGMDGSSELSELTEDEQEQDHKKSSPSKLKDDEDDEDDDEEDDDDEDIDGIRQYGSPKKKRGGLVPAPMWGWATSRSKKADSRSGPDAEEEEEEEMAGPPRAMEEEEDEDGDSAPRSLNGHPIDEDYDDSPYPEGSLPGPPKPPSKSHHGSNADVSAADALTQLRAPRKRALQALPLTPNDEDMDRHGDETEDEDEEEDEATSLKRPLAPASRWRRASILQPIQPDGSDPSEGEDEDDDATSTRRKPPANSSDNELDAQDDPDTEDEDDNVPLADDLDPDAEEAPSTVGLMAVDSTAPLASSIAPITAAAAATSITAGSGVIDPPSPSSSSASTPTSSRSPSPTQDDIPLVNGKAKKKGQKVLAEETPSRPFSRSADAKTRAEEPDAAQEDPDDLDADQDLDLELESDLQPAHRAEALDVLAGIELKFALLRERIYVEKIEGLAWEEALINEDIHPELIHLQDELSKRRDKRLTLAARRRDYDIKSVISRRKADEKGVWNWWKHSRDELQVDMIAETNRKRRKLERERRAFERPQPSRKTPVFVRDIPEGPSLRQAANTHPLRSRSSRKRGFSLVDFSPASFPDLSILSANDISADLELAYQHRRQGFDTAQRMPGPSVNGAGMMQVPYDGYAPNGVPLMDGMMPGPGMGLPPEMRMRQPMDMPPPVPNQPPSFAMGQPFGMSSIQSPSAFVADRDPMHSAGGPSLSHLSHQQQRHFGGPPGASGLTSSMTRPISPLQASGNGPGISGPGVNGGPSKLANDFGSFGRAPSMNNPEQAPRHTGGMDWSEGRRRDPGPSTNGDEFARPRDRAVVGGEKINIRERDYAMRNSQEPERKMEQQRERERERERERAAQSGGTHRQSHQHGQSHGPVPAHHHAVGHHHHRPHHHHIVHHHHPPPSGPGVPSGNTSSGPPPQLGYANGPAPGEFEPAHSRPSSSHNIEIINVSKPSPHWKRDELEGRDARSKQNHSRPPSTNPAYDDRDRPASTPFAIPPSQSFTGGPGGLPPGLSGPASSSHALSPRNPWLNSQDEPGVRGGPSPLSETDRFASPVPHRYSGGGSLGQPLSSRPAQPSGLSRPSSIGQSPPRNRNLPPSPSSLPYPPPPGSSGLHSPSRFSSSATMLNSSDATSTSGSSSATVIGGPGHPPPVGSGSTSPHMKSRRPGSPALHSSAPSLKQTGLSPPLTGPGQMPPPLVIDSRDSRDRAGSGAEPPHSSTTAAPRTASPLLSFVNGPGSRPGPSLHNPVKVNAIQMMDGP